MKFQIGISSEARREITEIALWYEDKRLGLGEEFLTSIIIYSEYLSNNAHSHPKVRGELRELYIRRFPYVIIYHIIDEKDVVILGLVHTKMHPSKRKKRK